MMAEGGAISLEEFKARLPLIEIVARHVRLTRRGREHLGLCPFHQEKTPSFTVSEAKGFYHCFGCGQHGNAIDFVMALEGLDFGQAISRLAELTGLPAPRRAGNGEPPVDRTLYAVNEAAARWLAGRLESAPGAEAAAYLAKRGLDRATILRFGLGYAPSDRTALKRALQAEGYAEPSAIEAGLLAQPEDGGPSFDRFRHRVMFPIHDRRGRIVGFGGRALGEARAKYLNTPDTPLFHKGELLYGLALARAAVREHGTVIVAEGYMDVIALAQAGFANAVAPLGTAVTEAQLALLWQLADEPVVCLDGDEAGLRAAHRLIERALPVLSAGKSLRFALLPPGQDPDSILRRRGRDFLAKVIAEAIPLHELLWSRESATRSLHVPQQRLALEKRFRELAATIPDRTLSRLFLGAFFKRLQLAAGRKDGAPGPCRPWLPPTPGQGSAPGACPFSWPCPNWQPNASCSVRSSCTPDSCMRWRRSSQASRSPTGGSIACSKPSWAGIPNAPQPNLMNSWTILLLPDLATSSRGSRLRRLGIARVPNYTM